MMAEQQQYPFEYEYAQQGEYERDNDGSGLISLVGSAIITGGGAILIPGMITFIVMKLLGLV